MEIVIIFVNFLYSIKYSESEYDEFVRLFELWQDVEYLENFFQKNIQDLQSGFYGNISVEEAVIQTKSEAKRLEKKINRNFKKNK